MSSPSPAGFPCTPLFDASGLPAALPIRSGGAILVIGHSECETSLLAFRHADALYRRRTQPMTVAVVMQDDPDAARAVVAELGLELPVFLDSDPFPLGQALSLTGVPVTLTLGPDGSVLEKLEAFRRADFEKLGELAGVPPPLFTPDDEAPALRPG